MCVARITNTRSSVCILCAYWGFFKLCKEYIYIAELFESCSCDSFVYIIYI